MTHPTIPQTLELALQKHQAGQLADALLLYQQILQSHPEHPQVLHLLGVANFQLGHPNEALPFIHRALTLQPNDPVLRNDLYLILLSLQRIPEVLTLWEQSRPSDPNAATALFTLGQQSFAQRWLPQARACFERLISLWPHVPDYHNGLGAVAAQQGHVEESLHHFHNGLARDPNYPELLRNVAASFRHLGRYEELLATARRVIQLQPNDSRGYRFAVDALVPLSQFSEAETLCRQALQLAPEDWDAWSKLGSILKSRGALEESENCFRRGLDANPQSAEWLSNLATIRQELGYLAESLDMQNRAVQIDPQHPGLRLNRSLTLLLQGRMAEAWPDYERRLDCPELAFLHRRYTQPRWHGQPLHGQRILLSGEQGLGDILHFVRYVPHVIAAGAAAIVIQCPSSLVPLLRTLPGVTAVVDDQSAPPPFDVHASLLSLPSIFQTTLETIPHQVPYLTPPVDYTHRWSHRMRTALTGRKTHLSVGLIWAGSPTYPNEWKRSLRLEDFRPLFSLPNITFFSLQKGHPAQQAQTTTLPLIDLTDYIHDFADTAALIAQLDLVIGVDTAPIHLAGALGKPVWTLLPFIPDWRWLLTRPDSPWYPTMRLFRQPALRAWTPVIEQITSALRSQ